MNTEPISQAELDKQNAEYWNEVCGTHLARNTKTEGNYKAFDAEYFKKYPFLTSYLDKFSGKVLEIGTGYGTVAQYLHDRCNYLGMDIAQGPLNVLNERGIRCRLGNVLDMYFDANSFDGVVSIGVLHHTGDISKALEEIHRILKPGGRALIMLYNDEAGKLAVDRNTKGERAPHIEYTNVKDLEALFYYWASYDWHTENGQSKDIYIEAIK